MVVVTVKKLVYLTVVVEVVCIVDIVERTKTEELKGMFEDWGWLQIYDMLVVALGDNTAPLETVADDPFEFV